MTFCFFEHARNDEQAVVDLLNMAESLLMQIFVKPDKTLTVFGAIA